MPGSCASSRGAGTRVRISSTRATSGEPRLNYRARRRATPAGGGGSRRPARRRVARSRRASARRQRRLLVVADDLRTATETAQSACPARGETPSTLEEAGQDPSTLERAVRRPVDLELDDERQCGLRVFDASAQSIAARRFAPSGRSRARAAARRSAESSASPDRRASLRNHSAWARRTAPLLARLGRAVPARAPGSSRASRTGPRPGRGRGSSRRATGACRARRRRSASAASSVQPPAKTASRAKSRCSSGLQEVVRPLDRRAQRLLSRLGVAAASEQVEPTAEPLEELLAREHHGSRRGELERERQVVEPLAEQVDASSASGVKSGRTARALVENSSRASARASTGTG